MAGNPKCECYQADLRAYLLQTLAGERQHEVKAHLADCGACRDALDAERDRFAILDTLPYVEAPRGLADRTLSRLRRPQKSMTGLLAAAAVLVLLAVPVYLATSKAREAERRASTQNNMKTLGLVFKMYAGESGGGQWPALASESGRWVPDLDQIYGEFLTDPQMLLSEQHPDRDALLEQLRSALESPTPDWAAAEALMGESYGYLGYSTDDLAEFETVYRTRATQTLPDDGSALGEGGPDTAVYPLREGIERFLITDINNPAASSRAQSTIPVLVEIATWKHKKSIEQYKGANVLYMDGHVEFVRFGTFPVVEPVLNALAGEQPSDKE